MTQHLTPASSGIEQKKNGLFSLRNMRQLWLPALFCLLLLFIEFYVLLFDVETLGDPTSQRPLVAFFKSGKNEIRTKRGGTLTWAIPQSEEKLFHNDVLATMDASSALVEFVDLSQIVVGQNSLVVFENPPVIGLGESFFKNLFNHLKSFVSKPTTKLELKEGRIRKTKEGINPLVIKVSNSQNPTRPTIVRDLSGKSLFEIRADDPVVIRVKKGEVQVEEQGVDGTLIQKKYTPNTKSSVQTNSSDLPPPKLHKPKIRVRKSKVNSKQETSHIKRVLDTFIFTPAYAFESQRIEQLVVELEWEDIPEASQYRLQISKSEDFSFPIIDRQVKSPKYEYAFEKAKAPQFLYYRVASIDSNGYQSEFSEIGEIEIEPRFTENTMRGKQVVQAPVFKKSEANRKFERKAEIAKKAYLRRKRKKFRALSSQEKLSETSLYVEPNYVPPKFKLFVSIGPIFHQRNFHGTLAPQEASVSGLSLWSIDLEPKKLINTKSSLSARFFYSPEGATPGGAANSQNLVAETTSIDFAQASLSFEHHFIYHSFAVGPYATTTHEFSFFERHVRSKKLIGYGLVFQWFGNPQRKRKLNWKLQLAGIGGITSKGFGRLNSIGVDLSGSVRFPFYALRSVSLNYYQGFYLELEGLGRYFMIERSYGGLLKIGYAI